MQIHLTNVIFHISNFNQSLMKLFNFTRSAFIALSMTAAFMATSCNNEEEAELQQEAIENEANAKIIPGQFLVVMKENDNNSSRMLSAKTFSSREEKSAAYEALRKQVAQEVSQVMRSHNIQEDNMKHLYSASFPGFAAKLSDAELQSLENDERIDYVEADQVVEIEQAKTEAVENARSMAQTTPWGISTVGYGNYAGGSRWAWVLDTGIQLDHPDLNVSTSWSKSYVGGTATDRNGHGTHVAGTIAAINNTTGVVGVAAGATVVAVKVLDDNGSGSISGIVAGVDYVKSSAYTNDVANMSLGGGKSTTLDNAVKNAAASGVYFALAAGNESQNANNVSPARVNGSRILTVSAHDRYDRWASFSNYANPPIDVCAPGVDVYSTWIGSGYRSISGTSMATPHIAGILLINNGTVYVRGYVSGDPDGNADPMGRK